ncbi:response regulator [Pedobacter sp. HMF7647]|uniref:Response regulator n=1 Tax=Hufsiella arboris TaxID=2695275 RepID=A0A7K1YCK5_9SPHI|nr:response regulator [Hufsiella arboris]MXV52111.1 response regulator [Hufsiella arboris]
MPGKILVLDDSEDTLTAVKDVLEVSGYEVKPINDWRQIFETLETFEPDLIILDYLLKDSNGGEICHQIKSNPRWNHVPVIILTAYPKVLLSLGTYGCDLFLEKPFDVQNFIDEVSKFFDFNATKQ